MYTSRSDRITWAILSALVLGSTAVLLFKLTTQAACLKRGWPEGKISFDLVSYCVKRVNQTDTVVPLWELTHGR